MRREGTQVADDGADIPDNRATKPKEDSGTAAASWRQTALNCMQYIGDDASLDRAQWLEPASSQRI